MTRPPVATLDAFVLAGGASTRMGSDKAILRFDGVTLIERTLDLLRSIGLTPRIVGDRADLERYAPVIPDVRSRCGPLSGLEAGLLASSCDAVLFLPVDLPLLPAEFLLMLTARAELTMAPATVPRVLGQAQPLIAVYRRDLLPSISQALKAGDYKVMRVMQQGSAALGQPVDIFDVESAIGAAGCRVGWPAIVPHAFLNCNTQQDLTRAARLADHLKG